MKAGRLVAVAAAVGALVLLPAGVAAATTVQVGGGLWSYGVTTDAVYSYYHHASLYHSSTACNSAITDQCHQAAGSAGQWSYASNVKTLWGNTAYWNTY